jgi:hypothetical protein
MTPTEYQWIRAHGVGAERWLLQEIWPDSAVGRIAGTVSKVRNKHRCRLWNVRRWSDSIFMWETVAVLRDMKTDQARDAAKLILLSLKENS